ncbi:MAG: hypothetical protein A2V88_04420 [Elusimicrobia bacterium RBG_16_66_12]|nr:MAG: hypothetical protein A2V88_04420 [Elusimicrobia bacterium RBG_16_66_12]
MGEGVDIALAGSILSTLASAAGAWAVIRRQVAGHDTAIDRMRERLEALEHWRSRELGEERARARTGPHAAISTPIAESGEHRP